MKTNLRSGLIATAILCTALIFSCQKADLARQEQEKETTGASATLTNDGTYRTGVTLDNGNIQAGGVTVTAPATVNVNENFSILAEVNCGRVAIQRGYILGPGNVKIYKNLTCATSGIVWEDLVNFQCYTADASWNGSLSEAGTYVYRTVHNSSDANCDGLGGSNQTGNCQDFNGNEFYCFMIEAIACSTGFSGEAISCDATREAVYTFKSINALSYIKIQGGLTNFTGADAVVTINGGNLTYTQTTPGGSSNRVIKIEGSVAACEEVTITITWNSTNSGGVITGQWSAKDSNGNDIAPPVPGLECSGRF